MRITFRYALLVFAAPALLMTALFVYPLLNALDLSFRDHSLFGGISDNYSLVQFRTIVEDPYFREVWLSTLQLAATSAVVTTAVGAAIAYTLWRIGGRTRRYLTVVILAPLLVSGVVRAYGWIAALAPNGPVSRTLDGTGIESSLLFTETTVLVGLVHTLVPYSIILVLTSLDSVNPKLVTAARSLGATSRHVLAKIIFPLCWSGLFASVLLTFALSVAAYAIPAILGGRRIIVASRVIYQQFVATNNWPLGAALSLTLIVLTLTVMLVSQRLTARSRARVEIGGSL